MPNGMYRHKAIDMRGAFWLTAVVRGVNLACCKVKEPDVATDGNWKAQESARTKC